MAVAAQVALMLPQLAAAAAAVPARLKLLLSLVATQ
jgi:hypothetical protein